MTNPQPGPSGIGKENTHVSDTTIHFSLYNVCKTYGHAINLHLRSVIKLVVSLITLNLGHQVQEKGLHKMYMQKP